MKKIIMISVVIFGIACNAAVANWNVDYTYVKGTTDYAEGVVAYFFDDAIVSRTAMVSAIQSNSFASLLSQGSQSYELSDEEGFVEGATADIYSNPQDIDGYFVLFDSSDAANAKFAYVSDIVTERTGETMGQSAEFTFGNAVETQSSSNWLAVNGGTGGSGDVPEPTSGLLLMLGVAGLALRRKVK